MEEMGSHLHPEQDSPDEQKADNCIHYIIDTLLSAHITDLRRLINIVVKR